MWSKLQTKTRSLTKIKEEGKRIGGNMISVLVGGGTAIGAGVLFTKFPNAAKIPGTEIDTGLALGTALVLVGVFAKGAMSGAVMSMGEGLLYPALYNIGATKIAPKLGQ
jgi:hypothetical protein